MTTLIMHLTVSILSRIIAGILHTHAIACVASYVARPVTVDTLYIGLRVFFFLEQQIVNFYE